MSASSVLVIGAGSAGQRHARLLREAGAVVALTDPDAARAGSVEGVSAVTFDLEALGRWDGIVIASPTTFHESQVPLALAATEHVLVEKPLAMTGAAARQLAAAAPDRLMVGYNLRLHRPYEALVTGIHEGRIGEPLSARLWFGSHLPDWRPSVDYRSTYSARRDLGGGVLLDAIHELDLLLWALPGQYAVLGASVTTSGQLEVDVEDNVHALLRHESGAAVTIGLDYLSRRYRRGIEVIGAEGTGRVDWARQVVEWESGDQVETLPATDPVMASYERQARRFLDWVASGTPPPVDGAAGAASVELADAIREAGSR